MLLDIIANIFLSRILVASIIGVGSFLAFVVYSSNPAGTKNKIYLTMTLLMVVWIVFAYVPRVLDGLYPALSLLLLKVAWFVTPIFFSFLYLLTIHLLDVNKSYQMLTKIVFTLGAFLAFVAGLTNLVIVDYVYQDGIVSILYGEWMLLFLGTVLFIIIATLVPIFQSKVLLKKKELLLFLVGLLIFYIFNATFNIILPIFLDISKFYFLGDYSTLILLGLTSYAVAKHQFFNIKVVATELFTFMVGIAILVEVFLAETWERRFFEIGLLIFVVFFGILLIKSVLREIAQKEKNKELAEKLKKANTRLKELDKLKSEFVSFATHQLRAPLTSIKGYTSMVLEGTYGEVPDGAREAINKVFKSSESLVLLVEDYLNISRIETGGMKYNFSTVDFGKLVYDVASGLESGVKSMGLKFFINIDRDKEYKANLDEGKMRQVITNLIDNAIKYTKKGSITVSLSEDIKRKKLVVKISDTGVGIAQATMPKLFKKFARSKNANETNIHGTGLGLYIAKEITVAHKGGKIWAESDGEGKGSVFFVEVNRVK